MKSNLLSLDTTKKITKILVIIGVVSYISHLVPYMGALGSFLLFISYLLLWISTSNQASHNNKIFRLSMIIEGLGIVVYICHILPESKWFWDILGFLLFLLAYLLLFKSSFDNDFR